MTESGITDNTITDSSISKTAKRKTSLSRTAMSENTVAEQHASEHAAPEQLRHTLHERGLRMTPQRQLVLDAVRELGSGTAEEICKQVQLAAPSVNITTIYRALDLLEELGLVRHRHLGHGAPRYTAEAGEHVHMVCHHCGSVEEVPAELLDTVAEALQSQRGFRLDPTHVALSGTCQICMASPTE